MIYYTQNGCVQNRDLCKYLEMCDNILENGNKSNQIKSNLFCHKFGTQYNNEFALHLAGQTGDNFALMSAHDTKP